jgi:hypothetical protein
MRIRGLTVITIQEINMLDLEHYIEIDWSGLCEDYDLKQGDISPNQVFRLSKLKEDMYIILYEFVQQNK